MRGEERGRSERRRGVSLEVWNTHSHLPPSLQPQEVFDFPLLKSFVARKDFSMVFDAMHAVTGPYAKRIFCEVRALSLADSLLLPLLVLLHGLQTHSVDLLCISLFLPHLHFISPPHLPPPLHPSPSPFSLPLHRSSERPRPASRMRCPPPTSTTATPIPTSPTPRSSSRSCGLTKPQCWVRSRAEPRV